MTWSGSGRTARPSICPKGPESVVRRVIIWRHGQTAHNAGGIFQGQLDTELSERGHEQARISAQVLAQREPTLLWSSDLARAAATAAALANETGLEVRHDARLREIHVGQWQGMAYADVVQRYPEVMAALDRGEDVVRGETGERLADVAARARTAFDDLLTTLGQGQTAVVATHGLAGRSLVADVLGMTYQQAWFMLVGLHNCHWAELVEHRTGWRLEAWNVGATSSVVSVTGG